MKIIKATSEELEIVKEITQTTVSAVYPQYYPKGAVEFFKNHHSDKNIMADIDAGIVYLLQDGENIVGTVTIKGNDINRLFVPPQFQHRGYGRDLLDFAETEIFKSYDDILLDASLPAKSIYIKRGYSAIEYHQIKTPNGDYLCYDVMIKHNK